MSKQDFPPLAVGTYIPTPEFISIAAHAAVMFERGCPHGGPSGLVATTGRAQDPEALRYARLFAAAPAMREALEYIAGMERRPIGDASEEMSSRLEAARVARTALAKARGEGD